LHIQQLLNQPKKWLFHYSLFPPKNKPIAKSDGTKTINDILTFFRHDRPERRAGNAGDVHRAGARDFDGVGGGRCGLCVRRRPLRRREHRRPGRSVDKVVQWRRLRGRGGGGRRRGRRRRSGCGGGRRGRPLGGHRGGG